jgi:hypothetical protein
MVYICVYITQMKTKLYTAHVKQLPANGRIINAHCENDNILVYQAYRHSIADFTVTEQHFGGADFSFNRMSWIKTSFLWMMYRSGWGQKEGQERILGIWIPKKFFEKILSTTVISSYSNEFYPNTEQWKKELEKSESRLQWDPDHDPFGKPLSRKAIQLGLKGSLLKEFATTAIIKIEDLTPFVNDQFKTLSSRNVDDLSIPDESVYTMEDITLRNRIGII